MQLLCVLQVTRNQFFNGLNAVVTQGFYVKCPIARYRLTIGENISLLADLVVINANVRTMDPRKPVAEAVAVKGKKIIKVGTNQEITRVVGKRTKVISLEGKTVVPGLIDTHVHVADLVDV